MRMALFSRRSAFTQVPLRRCDLLWIRWQWNRPRMTRPAILIGLELRFLRRIGPAAGRDWTSTWSAERVRTPAREPGFEADFRQSQPCQQGNDRLMSAMAR
jgi:hypothetical protein